jgi:hypothetical protein
LTPPSPLRPQLEHYVRALDERSDQPEERQDLGTFLTWLLRRSGYTIRLAPFHYDGPRRRVSKGRYQGGVDLVASRPGAGGKEDLFLFVLKRGDFGRKQWRDPTGILGDLNEVGKTKPSDHVRWLPSDDQLGRVTIIVCHNGEFDDEVLGTLRRNEQENIEQRGFGFEWWSAPELVDHALTVLAEGPDDQLFPPTVRPFYGLLLDGLTTTGQLPHDAVERLLDARLAKPPKAASAKELLRMLTELSLFAAMIVGHHPRARADALLDVLDMVRALITHSAAATVFAEAGEPRVREALADLLTTFVAAGERLAEALSPLARVPDGLALAGPGEQIDWPLRAARILRDLASSARTSAELAAYHRQLEAKAKADGDRKTSREASQRFEIVHNRCLAVCVDLAENNIGALATPITDDQLIEYAILWRTWLDGGQLDLLRRVIAELKARWVIRRRLGYPGPALYQHARTPMREQDVRVLAEAWTARSRPPSFEDGGSTLLPVVLTFALRLGVPIESAELAVFKPIKTPGGPHASVFAQSWSPPETASGRWYAEALSHEGVCHVHELEDIEQLVDRLLELHTPVSRSPMAELGFESIDAMAWVYWRTRPPLRWLLDALQTVSGAGVSQT